MGIYHNYQFKWILVFCLFALTVLLNLTSSLFGLSNHIFEWAAVIELIAISPAFFISIKRQKVKDDEYQQANLRLKSIFETLDVAIWSHDLRTGELLVTPGIEKLYGYPLEHFIQDPLLWKKVIYEEDGYVATDRERLVELGEIVTSEYRIIRPDGEVRWIFDRGIPLLNENGELIYFNSVLFDITDRKETEDRYRSLVEMSPDIIAVVSTEKIEYINEAGAKLVGALSPEELIGKSPFLFVPPSTINSYKRRVGTSKTPGEDKFVMEFQVKRLDGKTIDVEMSTTPILFEGRFAVQIVGRDITGRKKAEKTIKTMAYYDTLTGLPNRNRFKQYLNDVLHREGSKISAVLFLDLDRFKIINDTKGHTVGDLILQKVAGRLKNAVSEGFVSRQGGDEFIILLENTTKEQVKETAERILNEFSIPINLQNQEFFVTPSIGISLYPDDGVDEEALIKNADTAMYQAKERGKNNYQFYTPNLNGISIRKMELENNLRKALEQNQLTLHYQPQVMLSTGRVVGVEALIRWQHPQFGFIPPSEFIPLAEETGLIRQIGKWVLFEACKQRKAWNDAGIPPFPVAVNVSIRQFEDEHFTEHVISCLSACCLEPSYLELEITESIMRNRERTSAILHELKSHGVLLAIDDFGTGYSSLSYLKHFPIDKIKIDKSFVDDLNDQTSQGTMVKTIIDMGINLNFIVTAEGIETAEQLSFLKQNQCDIGQGYFYSKPLSAKDSTEYLLKYADKVDE